MEIRSGRLIRFPLITVKVSPFIKDLVFTTITSGLTVISLIIVTRLLAQGLGTRGFGAYSLARQIISTAIPVVTLGMGGALPRYIAILKRDDRRLGYLITGFSLAATMGALTLGVGFVFRDGLTTFVFNGEAPPSLLTATLFMLAGYSFYSVLFAFYRGIGEMRKANVWQLAVMALAPMAIALDYAKSGRIELILFLMGAVAFISLIPLALYSFRAISRGKKALSVKADIEELLRYSLPRIPGGFAFAGLLATGPFFASRAGSIKGAGYLVAGQSLFRIAEGGLEAFGIIILPKAARLFADDKRDFLRENVSAIVALVFHIGLFATLQLSLWADQIVLQWLGGQYVEAILLMRILLVALSPYLAFVMLRSIIDAIQKKAVNAFNLYRSLAITVVGSLAFTAMGLGTMGLAIGTTLGLMSLGFFTTRYIWTTQRLDSKALMIKHCLSVNVGLAIAAYFFKGWSGLVLSGPALISAAVLFEGLLLFLYCFILWKAKVQWMVELRKRVFIAQPDTNTVEAEVTIPKQKEMA